MPPRIPTPDDFTTLTATLPHTLHFPSPPESTTAILILLHGLGDTHAPFASFASAVNLPGVLAIAVRGTARVPLLGVGREGFHWGDDVLVDEDGGRLDFDPGFETAERLIMDGLIGEVLVGRCGWDVSDVMLFGFRQGGSLALGLASRLRVRPLLSSDAAQQQQAGSKKFKGVVSIGGPLPTSMVPTVSTREKSKTEVLLVQMGGESVQAAKREFEHVKAVNWARREVAMPRNREEMFPIMRFFADRLNSGW